jgi:hypothetical protein
MARLRVLAGKMCDALGSDVAVWTVYVAARLLGAASSAPASPAKVTVSASGTLSPAREPE